MATGSSRQLVLASTSPYRRLLLERLGVPFITVPPRVDETPRSDESPERLTIRLARDKADAVARHYTGAVIIGSDQVAALNGETLGKPGSRSAAIRQLQQLSGRQAYFHTAAVVLDAAEDTAHTAHITTAVQFRDLDLPRIQRYVDRDEPFDCAGSFRSEGLGIALCSAVTADDPTALLGLPLIAVREMLESVGFTLP